MRSTALIALSAATGALAHPHHGGRGWVSAELIRLLSEPDHLAMILAPLLAGLAWIGRRAWLARVRERAARQGGGQSEPD